MGQSNGKSANLPVVEPLSKEIALDIGAEILLGANESAAVEQVEPTGDQITCVLLGDDDIVDNAIRVETLHEINALLAEQGVHAVIAPKLHPIRISTPAAVTLYYIEIHSNIMDLGDFQLVSPNDLRVLAQ